jgi:two-component system response regulator (stage 0 sporulation protein F)
MISELSLDWEVEEEDPQDGDCAAGARVLVVDDDGAMRQLVMAALGSEGFEVNEAISGSDLAGVLNSIITDARPSDGVDLIILDLRMPGMTGLEIIRKLRAACWGTPAILMTAFPDPDVVAEATRLGVPVLAKPFALDVLTRTAISLLLAQGTTGIENDADGLKVSA